MSIQVTTIEKKRIVGDTLGEVLTEVNKANSPRKLSIAAITGERYSASFETDMPESESSEPGQLNLQVKNIIENGEYFADEGYDGLSSVNVNVPETIREIEVPVEVPANPNLQDKVITENGEYSADEGYDGLGNISVNVVPSEVPSEEAWADYLKWKQYHFTSYMGPETPPEGEIYDGMKITFNVTSEQNNKIELKAFSGSIQWGDGSYIEHIEDFATETRISTHYEYPYKFMSLSHTYNSGTYEIYFSKDFCNSISYGNGSNSGSYDLFQYTNWNNITILKLEGEQLKNLNFKNARFSPTELTIPYGITKVEDIIFESTNLTTVYLPVTIQTIGFGAFRNSSLTSIEIPKNGNLTEIGEYAFQECTLYNLTIPASVTIIKSNAFKSTGSNNGGVKNVRLLHTTPPNFIPEVFGNILKAIYVPYSSDHSILNTYKNTNGWSNYANIIYESDPD